MRIESLETQKFKLRHKKRRKARKELGLRCYGFLNDKGEFDCALFGYGELVYLLGSRFKQNDKGQFINARLEAEWLCNATFINPRLRMVEENISHFIFIGLDLDGDKLEIPLTDDMIRQRCFMLGLPMPLIIETSPNRFHVIFIFRFPVPVEKKEWYKDTQSRLHEAFEDLGSDKRLFKNLTYFQWNESNASAINKRHHGHPKVIIREKGELCSLSQISDTLKAHRYGVRKTIKERLEAFLTENPEYKGKQEALAKRLNSGTRRLKDAIKELRIEGKLRTKVGGKYENRITQFFYKPQAVIPIPEKIEKVQRKGLKTIQTTRSHFGVGLEGLLSRAWERAKAGGLPYGVRNSGLWMFGEWLKISKGLGFDGVLAELEGVFLLSRSQGKWFSVREFRGVVRSVCKDRYQRIIGKKALEKEFDEVFYALGFSESEVYGSVRKNRKGVLH